MFTECGKTEDDKFKNRKKRKSPEGTWTTPPVITVVEKAIMWEIENSTPKWISKSMHKHS